MKKHLPIIVAISLPILFVLVLVGFIYWPKTFTNSEYNFVYTVNENVYNSFYQYQYDVSKNKLETRDVIDVYNGAYPGYKLIKDYPPLYLYDVKTETSKEISLEEAKKLSLERGPSSPDGFSVNYRYQNYGIFELFGNDNINENGLYLIKDNSQKKLNIPQVKNYYDSGFVLVGWVLK